ncbi:hypothetical protein B0H14DRAFT_3549292 [Mycena olivaceomarginata]|nr:hypothetical protein B0H14DRAFT_3549292 [Mycena olivaceomarginata]
METRTQQDVVFFAAQNSIRPRRGMEGMPRTPRERDAGSGTKQDVRADGEAAGARIMRVGADMLWPAATVWTRHADAESPARHGKGGVARRVLDETRGSVNGHGDGRGGDRGGEGSGAEQCEMAAGGAIEERRPRWGRTQSEASVPARGQVQKKSAGKRQVKDVASIVMRHTRIMISEPLITSHHTSHYHASVSKRTRFNLLWSLSMTRAPGAYVWRPSRSPRRRREVGSGRFDEHSYLMPYWDGASRIKREALRVRTNAHSRIYGPGPPEAVKTTGIGFLRLFALFPSHVRKRASSQADEYDEDPHAASSQ